MSNTDIVDEIAGEEEAIEPDVEEVEAETPEGEETEPEKEEQPKERESNVPLAALQEERSRRQELQREIQEQRDKITRMEALWERTQQERAQAGRPTTPNPDEDPDGYYRAKIAELETELNGIKGQGQQRQEQEEQARQSQQLIERYASDVRRFAAETADFNDAYTFLYREADKDLQARGVTDPEMRSAILQQEEGQIVGLALREGRSPAEAIYGYAKYRGYKAGNGENRLDALQKGAAAAKSLSGSKGRTEGTITLERLAELDGEEFDKAWNEAHRKGIL